MPEVRDWMTVPEAQQALGVSRQRVYQLIGWGRLKATKVGATYRVDRSSVELRNAGGARLNSSQCVTSTEVADFFGVDVKTVRGWVDHGDLRARKINNRLCFNPDDVVRFVPPTYGGPGRHPARKPTRTLRGRVYPPPAEQPPT